MHNPHFLPGFFEIYTGPMKSQKSRLLLERIEPIRYTNLEMVMIEPEINTRKARKYSDEWIKIAKPDDIWQYVHERTNVIVLEEMQFLDSGIDKVVLDLKRQGKNIIGAGLNLNYRGEPFGQMGRLMTIANKINMLTAICESKGCDNAAEMTQRLVYGIPSHYNDPEILIGDRKEGYSPRCLLHHQVRYD